LLERILSSRCNEHNIKQGNTGFFYNKTDFITISRINYYLFTLTSGFINIMQTGNK